MMTPQAVLSFLAIPLFIAAVVLGGIAVYVFFKSDIRGVRDDLSGKTRRQDIENAREKGPKRTTRSKGDDAGKRMRTRKPAARQQAKEVSNGVKTAADASHAERASGASSAPSSDGADIPKPGRGMTYSQIADGHAVDKHAGAETAAAAQRIEFNITRKEVIVHSDGLREGQE